MHCDGVLCRACSFFAPESGCLTLDQFVKSWGNTTQKMNNHSSLDYHLTACTRMSEFLAKYNSVNIMLDSKQRNNLKQTRKLLNHC